MPGEVEWSSGTLGPSVWLTTTVKTKPKIKEKPQSQYTRELKDTSARGRGGNCLFHKRINKSENIIKIDTKMVKRIEDDKKAISILLT